MDDRNGSRSGLQTAADLARLARSLVHVAKAAAVSGLHGAAVAAAKEALPFLVKLAICVLVVLLLIPMLIFTALPNMFFGYENSGTTPVIGMTQQAMLVGGIYMSLEDFERTQVDALVTSIVNEYENSGQRIDRIDVESSFNEEDLMWFIAINSVGYRQDLYEMDVEKIRSFSASCLDCSTTLTSIGKGEQKVTTLRITVKHLNADEIMDQLGFDEEARTWAGALYETLKESGALAEYAPYYEAYRPSYEGDTSYDGEVEYGNSYSNDIDISKFVDPSTKNNLDLVAYAIQAWEHNWGYVWGTYGNVLTDSLFAYKLEQYPEGVGNYEEFIKEHWLGRRTTDCVGLIKGYGWLDTSDMTIGYAENGMPDYGANQMYQAAVNADADHGPMSEMPEIVGLAVWKEGHIGVYIGNGYVIEAMSTKKGVVRTEVDGRGWEGWCKIPYIEYWEDK